MQTKHNKIVARIEQLGLGKAFSAKDFLDIASRTMIDVTLASLAQSGKIRRIKRGLYDMPRMNAALGGGIEPGHRRGGAGDSSKATMEDRPGRCMGCEPLGPLDSSAI